MVGTGFKWVSASQFGRMLKDPVSPTAVSKWVKEGKLPPEMIREKKRGYEISTAALPIANAMRCPGQVLGTGEDRKARSDLPEAVTSPPVVAIEAPPADTASPDPAFRQFPAGESDAERYARARADKAEQEARDGIRKAAEQEGRLLDAAEQAAAWRKVTSEIIGSLEAALPEMADKLFAVHAKDPREMRAALRDEIRLWRAVLAKQQADLAADLPEQIPVTLDRPGEGSPGDDTGNHDDPGAEPGASGPDDLGGSTGTTPAP